MGTEFELKYAATAKQQRAVAQAFGTFASISMETTYYDTQDGALSEKRITLRKRLENGTSVFTVKTPGAGFSKGEWEAVCDTLEAAIPILCELGCPVDLPALTKSGVIPICGARFTRQVKTVPLPGCTIELALDSGVLLGGGREETLCEIELELKSGSEAAAIAFAEAMAEKYGLLPEKKSKFRRALALAKGD